jgi:hypothetical protein
VDARAALGDRSTADGFPATPLPRNVAGAKDALNPNRLRVTPLAPGEPPFGERRCNNSKFFVKSMYYHAFLSLKLNFHRHRLRTIAAFLGLTMGVHPAPEMSQSCNSVILWQRDSFCIVSRTVPDPSMSFCRRPWVIKKYRGGL